VRNAVRILRLVLGHGVALALVGGMIGIVASLGVARLMEGLLFGVGAADSTTYTVVFIGGSLRALLAYLIPACCATAVDTMDALRVD
jgi:ABC-type antimicrobial peptide transport system permease subunit